jgi:hypothetical protein
MQLLMLNSRNPPEYLPDKMAPALHSRIPGMLLHSIRSGAIWETTL